MKIPIIYKIFTKLLNLASHFATRPVFSRFTNFLMRFFANLMYSLLRGKAKNDLKEIGLEWQRMFLVRELFPIKKIENNTLYAEIHQPCPLRGSGDVLACYKLMQYDRSLLKKIGGQLVVIRSQAEENVKICQVLIRKKGASIDDLKAAHER